MAFDVWVVDFKDFRSTDDAFEWQRPLQYGRLDCLDETLSTDDFVTARQDFYSGTSRQTDGTLLQTHTQQPTTDYIIHSFGIFL